jgi:hypothetical protein
MALSITTLKTDPDQTTSDRELHAVQNANAMPWLAMLLVVMATVVTLSFQGRVAWCSCGGISPWTSDIWSSHCSQHLFDPYSLSHILHGLVFYALLAWLCPKMPSAWRLCLAIVLEAGWEVIENSEFTIQRYRTATMALDYMGDSIANSLGDIFCCGLGFLLAKRLGGIKSLALFLGVELVMLAWIRDNLSLNVIMLICPIDAIKAWQMMH